jgi:hypothetical protein
MQNAPTILPADRARALLAERRRFERAFGPELFADPARDILLDLFIAAEEQHVISISSCCIAAQVPQTTALRWINQLGERGLIEYLDDPTDRRRRLVRLTAETHRALSAYFQRAPENTSSGSNGAVDSMRASN